MSNYCNEHHSSYEKGSHYNNDYIRPNPQLQSQAKWKLEVGQKDNVPLSLTQTITSDELISIQ